MASTEANTATAVHQEAAGVRKRTQTACEACRVTKIRCEPSIQPGVCLKCLESKRECVSRRGPRTRRSRRSKTALGAYQSDDLPPLPKPSGTFTIDFEVSVAEDVDENFETLRDSHMAALESLFPTGIESDASSRTTSNWRSSQRSTAVSSGAFGSHSISSLQTKPVFNIASAETLLQSFLPMLDYYPIITVPSDIKVRDFAATRPFILLAILAAASGSRTLQGHNLYDEEFKKVLALKVVAKGESTLELLQGILIYCAWYPFHLRPKNKQVFQYIRMASELVHNLELEDESLGLSVEMEAGIADDACYDSVRAYLGYFYLTTMSAIAWKSHRSTPPEATPWTSRCCDLLETHAQVTGDAVLACLVRLCYTAYDITLAYTRVRQGHSEQQSKLVLMGLEAQLAEQESRITPEVSATVPVQMQKLFVRFCLNGDSLTRLPRSQQTAATMLAPSAPIALGKLHELTYNLRQFFDLLMSLDDSAFLSFVAMDWAKFVISVILALRLSFPLKEAPEFDDSWARSELCFERFLDKFSTENDLTATSKKVDILSAGRIVVGIVKTKYQRQLDAHMEATAAHPGSMEGMPKVAMGCPVLDGSMEKSFPAWDSENITPGFSLPLDGASYAAQDTQPAFQDLWSTMTLGWAAIPED